MQQTSSVVIAEHQLLDSDEEEDVSNILLERISPHLEAVKIQLLHRLNLYTSEEENELVNKLYPLDDSDNNNSTKKEDDMDFGSLFDEELKLLCKYWKEEVVLRIKSGMIRKDDQESPTIAQFLNNASSEQDRHIAVLVQEVKVYRHCIIIHSMN
jgi:hypothetical protein